VGTLGKKVNFMKPLDIDKIPIRKDPFFTNAYVIELPLDSQPDYIWQVFFEQEWKSSLHLWERKVVIVGDKLLLITTSNEFAQKIDWLRKVMESTNTHVEEFNRTQRVIEEAEKAEALREHENIIKDAIRMKLGIA